MTLKKGHTLEEDFEIEEDAVALDGVVVSANRNEQPVVWHRHW